MEMRIDVGTFSGTLLLSPQQIKAERSKLAPILKYAE